MKPPSLSVTTAETRETAGWVEEHLEVMEEVNLYLQWRDCMGRFETAHRQGVRRVRCVREEREREGAGRKTMVLFRTKERKELRACVCVW